jgi:glycosyltransferase involved in cell wall biosynthesis
MRIAQVAPLFESVPPKLYGGTERVVSWLTEALVDRGHEVTLFASADSVTSARLIATQEQGIRLGKGPVDGHAAHLVQLGAVTERAREFDVIHCHTDYAPFLLGQVLPTPLVHTLHGRLDLPSWTDVCRTFPDTPLVSISDSQRAPLARLPLNWRATVYHGLPIDGIPFEARGGQGGYLAFLGRFAPEKGPEMAVAVARKVGIPLRIAAKVDPADREYFEASVRPLIDGTLVQWVGEIGDDEKWKFLGEALALLFPIDWPEPFGLAMIEALACGTPVIARPCGSVPEIVVDGETGILGGTVDDLAAGVRRVEQIDRQRCRQVAEKRFSVDAMTASYERVYREL